MKKITLAIALFMGVMTMNAQADCANAESIAVVPDGSVTVNAGDVAGTAPSEVCNQGYYTATDITMGSWFTFTEANDLIVTINAKVPSNTTSGYVPSYSVYSGACGSTTCIGGILVTQSQAGALNDAELTFLAEGGTDYFIVFDDFYANDGLGGIAPFDFTVTTDSNIPNLPDAVTDPTPVDQATDVVVGDDAGTPFVSFAWKSATTGGNADSYEIFLSDPTAADPTELRSLGSTSNNSVDITNMTFGDTYYWKVIATNAAGQASGSTTWSFTTIAEAGVEDFTAEAFTQYVQAGSLNVESTTQIESITLFNILGQQVATQKVNDTKGNVSLSQLNSGVYLAKVQLDGQTKTFKFVKK